MSGEASGLTTSGSSSKADDDVHDVHDLLTATGATSGSSNSSWLDELQLEGDHDASTVYTYTSSWSTNYTMSNLVGPGRLLGKLYSRAGSSLERGIGKLAYRAGLGSQAKAESLLQGTSKITSLMMSDDADEHERACELLLPYASDAGVQKMVFEEIVYQFCAYPIRLRDAFEKVFLKRKQRADIVVFSWKRSGAEYTPVWIHHYKLVSRCLSTTRSPFMIAATRFGHDEHNTMSFSKFEEMLSACSGINHA
ncbi:hypothetical protein SCHPADRAFT_318909 [Schizopora paradoxa]|uniref:Uncharacterized protein n=1 Tax=Schizopora paradoxa TaxID=27342 RepID=A0A0H2SBQ1_9AGAM|nr:hypothetical protein SCHPADRAFT_318909 [Schizopora paradoxa]